MCDDAPFALPVLYTGPTPSPPATNTPPEVPPTITLLSPQIINSIDKLFFISHTIGNAATRKWHLVRVAFCDTMSLYPSALQDRCFLVEFYVAQPNDVWYNATNQCFWLQYRKYTTATFGTINAHLITPSNTLEEHALHHNLVPIRCWVNLTHGDTFIHGPFEFAMVRACKTRDCIGQDDWNALVAKISMFVNKIPKFDLPTYSIHVDRGVHSVFHSMAAAPNCDNPLPP
jgi:hypothetical protein